MKGEGSSQQEMRGSLGTWDRNPEPPRMHSCSLNRNRTGLQLHLQTDLLTPYFSLFTKHQLGGQRATSLEKIGSCCWQHAPPSPCKGPTLGDSRCSGAMETTSSPISDPLKLVRLARLVGLTLQELQARGGWQGLTLMRKQSFGGKHSASLS